MAREDVFFRVNEVTECLNAVSMMRTFIVQSKDDSYYFKWSIIAAHNSLQAFMVLALKGTSNIQVIKWDNKKYRGKSQFEILSDPNQKLDNFLNLFEKIKSTEFMNDGIFVDLAGEVSERISNLNDIRNNFIHYLPCSWSLSIDLAKQVILASITVLAHLSNNCSEVIRNFTQQELCAVKVQIDLCRAFIINEL